MADIIIKHIYIKITDLEMGGDFVKDELFEGTPDYVLLKIK